MRDGCVRHFTIRNIILPFRKRWKMERKPRRKTVCRRCGTEVRWERERHLRKEYPYYCPGCDENMYSFECMEVQTSGGFGNAGSK